MAQLTPEELQQIKDIQSKYNQTIFEIGIVEAQSITFQNQIAKLQDDKKNLVSDLETIERKETELLKSFEEKYGKGSINPNTGEITAIQ